MGVLTAAGVTQLTRTPVSASSLPKDLVKPMTAAIEQAVHINVKNLAPAVYWVLPKFGVWARDPGTVDQRIHLSHGKRLFGCVCNCLMTGDINRDGCNHRTSAHPSRSSAGRWHIRDQ